MKTLHLTVFVTSIGDTSIQVPDHMTLEEALQYAKEHMDEVALPSNLDPAHESMQLDEENCDFEDVPGDDEPAEPCRPARSAATALYSASTPTPPCSTATSFALVGADATQGPLSIAGRGPPFRTIVLAASRIL